MANRGLPFKVGQYAEAQTFESGFRGAWFRCKITKIDNANESARFALQYYDFPGEKIGWTKLYKKRHRYDGEEHVMVRPCYPPVYCEGELPDTTNISEVVVVVNDAWKVGDLVDWWTDSCYWSGKLVKKLSEETFQIELLPPPFGEGSSYEVSRKDLRPSLDWSPKHGWTVALQAGKTGSSCAQLIQPKKQQDWKGNQVSAEHKPSKFGTSEGCCFGNFSRDSSGDTASNSDGNDSDVDGVPSKRMRSRGTTLNFPRSGTIDAAILDLEELVTRVKWMKGILQSGMASSNSRRNGPSSSTERLPSQSEESQPTWT